MYLEVEICGIDSLPKEMSELYKQLKELDPLAAEQSLYTVDVPLGKPRGKPRTDDE